MILLRYHRCFLLWGIQEEKCRGGKGLIADLAKCNMKAPSLFIRSYRKARGNGVIKLNKITAMEAKLDAIMHRMDKQEKRLHSAYEIEAMEREGIRRSAEGPTE